MSQWGYTKENGPDKWGHYAPAANGNHQSPIVIKTTECVHDVALTHSPLNISYFPERGTLLKNTGHGFQVSAQGGSGYGTLQGGPYHHRFQLEQFHFHWGRNSAQGSEHVVDGKEYASELHLVHWNTDLFTSFAQAAQSPCGLAVLAVLIRVGNEHKGLLKLTNLLAKVPFSGDETEVKDGFDPHCLLPKNLSNYYTYVGSLTTPPCYESIQFLIFKDTIEVSEAQLTAFRELFSIKHGDLQPHDEFKGKIFANFRPPQPLNDRNVLKSF